MLNVFVRVVTILWASPYTILGILIGVIGLCTGGGVRIRGPVIQFYGGGVRWLLCRTPLGTATLAMTLGHSVLGQTTETLDISYEHELVHVRQFQRWGPLMGPAYFLASAWVWWHGGRSYRDNPFEKEAYESTELKQKFTHIH